MLTLDELHEELVNANEEKQILKMEKSVLERKLRTLHKVERKIDNLRDYCIDMGYVNTDDSMETVVDKLFKEVNVLQDKAEYIDNIVGSLRKLIVEGGV